MAKKIYSLWLMPAGGVRTKFSRIIKKLAKEYSAPVFDPHVTLVGAISAEESEIIERTGKLTSMISPYTLTLGNVGYMDIYFRALFVKATVTPQVQDAYNNARKIFPISNSEEYMPHLSLLYKELSVDLKKKIIMEIGNRFTDRFVADKLHLYETDGEVETWKKVQEFTLNNKSHQ